MSSVPASSTLRFRRAGSPNGSNVVVAGGGERAMEVLGGTRSGVTGRMGRGNLHAGGREGVRDVEREGVRAGGRDFERTRPWYKVHFNLRRLHPTQAPPSLTTLHGVPLSSHRSQGPAVEMEGVDVARRRLCDRPRVDFGGGGGAFFVSGRPLSSSSLAARSSCSELTTRRDVNDPVRRHFVGFFVTGALCWRVSTYMSSTSSPLPWPYLTPSPFVR